jgi:hypothetical protein
MNKKMKRSLNFLKKLFIIFIIILFGTLCRVHAQCSMCTKTASQLGEKPALGLNNGILYLMLAPFFIVGFLAYRWWSVNKKQDN